MSFELVRASYLGYGALFLFACSTPAEALRPTEPTAAAVLEQASACVAVGRYGEPLVVDWPDHERSDLEEAMRDGVAVLAYDCKSLRLLRGCSVEGSYGFMSVSRKERGLQLTDEDQLHAALPAGILANQFEADIARGMSLDIATILVGKKRTTVFEVPNPALRGGAACDGATHFLKGAHVGAFALDIGTQGAVRGSAAIFASASSKSTKVSQYRDGQPDACVQLTSDQANPSCNALIRLELVAIGEPAPEGDKGAAEPVVSPCPQGLVLVEGKCARPSSSKPHLCQAEDVRDCETQCARGDAPSCANFAFALAEGRGVTRDAARAASLYARACDAGIPLSCASLGGMYESGAGGTKDLVRAAAFYERSCREGLAVGCGLLAGAYSLGKGVPQNDARAAGLFERSCDGGVGPSCGALGALYVAGMGVPKNVERAVALFKRGCEGHAPVCLVIGDAYAQGRGMPKDPERASEFYRRACNAGVTEGCNRLAGAPPAGTNPASASDEDEAGQPNDRIDVPGVIEFDDGKATLKRGSENERTLSSVKAILDASPRITKLRIEGHMDNTLSPTAAESLTGRRALEVKKALVRLGVASERLLAVGFGQNMPVADNATAQGRAKNRRVEFHVAAIDGRSVRSDEAAGGKVFR